MRHKIINCTQRLRSYSPYRHKTSRLFLINAVTGEVKSGQKALSGYATYQELIRLNYPNRLPGGINEIILLRAESIPRSFLLNQRVSLSTNASPAGRLVLT